MKPPCIAYDHAIAQYRSAGPGDPVPAPSDEELLERFHPDHAEDATTELLVGPNRGEPSHPQVARLLQSNSLVDDADLAGADVVETDVVIVGGGGAGCAAAIAASDAGL